MLLLLALVSFHMEHSLQLSTSYIQEMWGFFTYYYFFCCDVYKMKEQGTNIEFPVLEVFLRVLCHMFLG